MFMAHLQAHRVMASLTEEANRLLKWLWGTTDAWSYRNVIYPLTGRILETIIKHRYNVNNINYLGRNCYTTNRRAQLSSEAAETEDSYKTLTTWMFTYKQFDELYADWLDRFNEEARSMLRTFPYLFKEPEELLYSSLVSKSLQHTNKQK